MTLRRRRRQHPASAPGIFRGARFGRGPGRPDHEPNEARQTDTPGRDERRRRRRLSGHPRILEEEARAPRGPPPTRVWPLLGSPPACGSPSSRTSTPTSRPWTRCSRPPARSTPSGTSATSWATGPEPDAVVERLRDVGAIGVRGNHDAAACGGDEIDWFNPEARRAMEWTRRRDLRVDGRVAVRAPGAPHRSRAASSSTAARASRSGSTSRRVPSPAPTSAALGAPIGLHGHTHIPVAFVEDGGRLSVVRGRAGERARARWAAGARQPRQRRAAARRRPGRLVPASSIPRPTGVTLAPRALRRRGGAARDARRRPAGLAQLAPGGRAVAAGWYRGRRSPLTRHDPSIARQPTPVSDSIRRLPARDPRAGRHATIESCASRRSWAADATPSSSASTSSRSAGRCRSTRTSPPARRRRSRSSTTPS